MTENIYWGEAREGHILRVAVPDIYDEFSLERIRVESGCRLEPEQHTEAEIQQMIRAAAVKDVGDTLAGLEAAPPPSGKAHSWESEPIINLADSLLEAALERGATDIHLEPCKEGMRIRFRRDGMLEIYRTLPEWICDPLLIRFKLLADVDITEKRLPHDGSFHFQGCHESNVRLSTLPTHRGEKCVLRLLPAHDGGTGLDALGFHEATLRQLRNTFAKPQGLFLVTGPTGSGKTTTLYAGLREIIKRKVNVTTIEDPVEYPLDGANQVQVNEKCGLTFAAALRSILRQDPDVILVGEIRDEETARIAVRAAETGHLVLSTLHTNSAKAARDRLLDLGISANVLEDVLLGVAAQRLLRKKTGSGGYRGRIAATEILKPDGSYVEGNIREYAESLVHSGITDLDEVNRVLA